MAGKRNVPKPDIEEDVELNEDVDTNVEVDSDEIIVNDPQLLRPVELPLVVKLPASASKAQIAYAKVLNAYAYINPKKWKQKKDTKNINGQVVIGLIDKLKALKDAPDPEEPANGSLTIGRKNNLLD